jgi:hypothetical protein
VKSDTNLVSVYSRGGLALLSVSSAAAGGYRNSQFATNPDSCVLKKLGFGAIFSLFFFRLPGHQTSEVAGRVHLNEDGNGSGRTWRVCSPAADVLRGVPLGLRRVLGARAHRRRRRLAARGPSSRRSLASLVVSYAELFARLSVDPYESTITTCPTVPALLYDWVHNTATGPRDHLARQPG